jgi:aspartokinase-like uncharacterized kinase
MTDSWQPEPIADGWLGGWLRWSDRTVSSRPLVIKIGGSLLSRSGWPMLVGDLITAESAGQRLVHLIVGGGPIVDGLRQIDQVEPQPADQMHRLAIAAMSLTAEVVAGELGLPRVTDLNAATSGVLDISRSSTCLAAIAALPCNWTVTSDSIAAAVAASTNAELLLAKSVVPQTSAIPSLVATGWLDGYFATASNNLSSIRWAAPALERSGLH